MVGNLTTASNTVRGFTTLLLGLHFAERIAEGEEDRDKTRLAFFLKFEQLAGYARFIRNDDSNMRGITEIKRRVAESDGRRIPIGDARDRQILSNQKIYGLWGLYTMPSIDSDLLLRADLTLAPLARELLERQYLPIFRQHGLGDGEAIENILAKDRADLEPEGKHSRIFDALAKILAVKTTAREREAYHNALVRGGSNGERLGWQPRFAELVETRLPGDKEFDHDSLTRVIAAARKSSQDEALAAHLERIQHLEGVLVVMANLFGFLQDRDQAVVSDLPKQIGAQWHKGLKHLRPDAIEEMQADIGRVYESKAAGERFTAFAQAVKLGQFDGAIQLLLDHNGFVMNARNKSQPWIRQQGKKLQVRYRDESQVMLAEPVELAKAWRNGFYLNPLKQVSDELRRSA